MAHAEKYNDERIVVTGVLSANKQRSGYPQLFMSQESREASDPLTSVELLVDDFESLIPLDGQRILVEGCFRWFDPRTTMRTYEIGALASITRLEVRKYPP